MDNTITLSVEELKQMINAEVQKAIKNSKPVKDARMKELETRFKEDVYAKKLDMNWYSAWSAIRMSVALRMGFRLASKVPQHRYNELLENIKNESEMVMEAFTKEEKQKWNNYKQIKG